MLLNNCNIYIVIEYIPSIKHIETSNAQKDYTTVGYIVKKS